MQEENQRQQLTKTTANKTNVLSDVLDFLSIKKPNLK